MHSGASHFTGIYYTEILKKNVLHHPLRKNQPTKNKAVYPIIRKRTFVNTYPTTPGFVVALIDVKPRRSRHTMIQHTMIHHTMIHYTTTHDTQLMHIMMYDGDDAWMCSFNLTLIDEKSFRIDWLIFESIGSLACFLIEWWNFWLIQMSFWIEFELFWFWLTFWPSQSRSLSPSLASGPKRCVQPSRDATSACPRDTSYPVQSQKTNFILENLISLLWFFHPEQFFNLYFFFNFFRTIVFNFICNNFYFAQLFNFYFFIFLLHNFSILFAIIFIFIFILNNFILNNFYFAQFSSLKKLFRKMETE